MEKIDPFKKYKSILEKYLLPGTPKLLSQAWIEPWRKYHNIDHLKEILNELEKWKNKSYPIQWDALVLAAFFHDAVYVPIRKDNEDQSISRFLANFINKNKSLHNIMSNKICQMIESTKFRKRPTDPLLQIFWDADNAIFKEGIVKLTEYEKKIREEFKFYSNLDYKKGRLIFLNSCIGTMGPKVDQNIKELIEFVKINY
ncbi:MAG: hypothetical protein PHF86_01275 [Candidatus Nanoarchaeia archaeon]|nr:hypothetical protein [Candidatus Nanoarchaeia archaeon]